MRDEIGVAFEFIYPAGEYGEKTGQLANRSTRLLRATVFGDDVDMLGAESKYSL